jgi:guanylate kinase
VENLWLSRSWTTRPRRSNDAPDAYVFVDRPTFEEKVAAGGFLEWNEVYGQLYGTPSPEPPAGSDVLLEIDVQGAADVKAQRPDSVVVLVLPPSTAAQEERLRRRGDREESIETRLAKAAEEERAGRALADHVVVNDDLSQAVDEVVGIVESHRRARET